MAEVVHFKTIRTQSRRRRVEAAVCNANPRPPELRCRSKIRTFGDIGKRDPGTAPSVMDLIKTVVIPLIIVLCSIAAFAIFVAHISGQPGYSARNNVSSSTLVE